MEFAHPPPGPPMGGPPQFNMPPPMHGHSHRHMGPMHHHQPRPFFRPQGGYGGGGGNYRAPNGMPISQDDFDGKRLRKSVMRKTVDYNASIVNTLEVRPTYLDNYPSHSSLNSLSHYFSLVSGNVTGGTAVPCSRRISTSQT